MANASLWSGMKNEKPGGGGNYFPPGFKGEVKIKRVFVFSEGFNANEANPLFIAETEVVTSNLASVPMGCERSFTQGKLTDKRMRKTALGEICGFVAAVLGVDVEDPTVREGLEARMEQITGEANPLAGRHVIVETWAKPKRDGSGDFTKHKFTAVPKEVAS